MPAFGGQTAAGPSSQPASHAACQVQHRLGNVLLDGADAQIVLASDLLVAHAFHAVCQKDLACPLAQPWGAHLSTELANLSALLLRRESRRWRIKTSRDIRAIVKAAKLDFRRAERKDGPKGTLVRKASGIPRTPEFEAVHSNHVYRMYERPMPRLCGFTRRTTPQRR